MEDIGKHIETLLERAALFLFILFASLGLAFWLGETLGKIYFGFFAIAVIYGLLGILIPVFAR